MGLTQTLSSEENSFKVNYNYFGKSNQSTSKIPIIVQTLLFQMFILITLLIVGIKRKQSLASETHFI